MSFEFTWFFKVLAFFAYIGVATVVLAVLIGVPFIGYELWAHVSVVLK